MEMRMESQLYLINHLQILTSHSHSFGLSLNVLVLNSRIFPPGKQILTSEAHPASWLFKFPHAAG